MSSLKIFFQNLVILAIVLFNASTALAQIYQIGDVYEFPDGSKGVICYVNPDNPTEGWAVALNDVGWISKNNNQSYFLLTSDATIPSEITTHPYNSVARCGIDGWTYEGEKNTRLLFETHKSPAAEALDYYNGWYIPDAIQLRHIFGLIPFIQNSIISAGGDEESLKWMYWYNTSNFGHDYWSSTRTDRGFLVVRGSQYFYDPRNPLDNAKPDSTKVRIRAVRDFGTKAYGYWVDNPKNASMEVTPDVTTAYQAYVIFNSDTLRVTSSAVVHSTVYGDTTANACTSFTWRDSTYTSTPTMNPTDTIWGGSMYGCDSIVTLHLTISPQYAVEINDTVCSNAFPHTVADTTFLDGTVSDTYVLHRTTAQGCDSMITINLYVIPPISSAATFTCPPNIDIVLPYGVCDTLLAGIGDPVYAPTPALDGIAYTITDNTPASKRYPVGNHIVTWTVTDACGLSLSCDQQVNMAYPPCGTMSDSVTDYDGFRYPTVRIGCQCWMAENLRSTHYFNGTAVANYHVFNDSDSLGAIYGKLYSWYTAARVPEGDNDAQPTSATRAPSTYVQGICPDGWALPTPEEYADMLAAAGGSRDNIKEASTKYWLPGFEGTSPNSGFNARGAGDHNALNAHYQYENFMTSTKFWTASNTPATTQATAMVIPCACGNLEPENSDKRMGYSVRCVKKK